MRWVVVGAGSGGCVAAGRLAEDPSNDVTLLECGPTLGPGAVPASIEGADFLATLVEPGRTHEALVARRGPRTFPYPRGRGVGGSSAVNAMIALRGDPRQYTGWGWDDTDRTWAQVRLPEEVPDDDELGAVDRALLDADPVARSAPLTRRDGRRITSAEAYLWPVWDRANLTVRADAGVDRVVIEGRRAVGVRLDDGTDIAADRVVVAAGAIHTPVLLLRSGVTGAGIGDDLQDHPAVSLTLELTEPATGGLAAGALAEHGPIHLVSLNHTGPDEAGRAYGSLLIGLLRPVGRGGSVRVPLDGRQPDIRLAELTERQDLDALTAGLERARGLLARPEFRSRVREVYVDEHGTRLSALTADHVDEWLRSAAGTYFHAASTCAMGRVVDSTGRVSGLDDLYVCDASVFPSVPHANTHLPTTMLAERLVAHWATP